MRFVCKSGKAATRDEGPMAIPCMLDAINPLRTGHRAANSLSNADGVDVLDTSGGDVLCALVVCGLQAPPPDISLCSGLYSFCQLICCEIALGFVSKGDKVASELSCDVSLSQRSAREFPGGARHTDMTSPSRLIPCDIVDDAGAQLAELMGRNNPNLSIAYAAPKASLGLLEHQKMEVGLAHPRCLPPTHSEEHMENIRWPASFWPMDASLTWSESAKRPHVHSAHLRGLHSHALRDCRCHSHLPPCASGSHHQID